MQPQRKDRCMAQIMSLLINDDLSQQSSAPEHPKVSETSSTSQVSVSAKQPNPNSTAISFPSQPSIGVRPSNSSTQEPNVQCMIHCHIAFSFYIFDHSIQYPILRFNCLHTPSLRIINCFDQQFSTIGYLHTTNQSCSLKYVSKVENC